MRIVNDKHREHAAVFRCHLHNLLLQLDQQRDGSAIGDNTKNIGYGLEHAVPLQTTVMNQCRPVTIGIKFR